MNENDDNLRALLRQWPDIEPRASFETDVWRRLRLAQAAPGLFDWLQQWTWRPVLATATAIVLTAAVASSVGAWTATNRASAATNELLFMSAGTLAGGYAKLTTGASR